MHNSLRALLGGTVLVEGDAMPVAGAWLDTRSSDRGRWVVRHVGLDVGGWLDSHVALVPAERLSWSEEVGGWSAGITRDEVEAPDARLDDQGEGGAIDLSALPPVVTGPFGHTISPLLIGAGLMAEAEEERPPRPPGAQDDEDAAPRDEARTLDRARDWLGASLELRGPLRTSLTVEDLLVEAHGLRLTHLVVSAAGAARAVPIAHVGRLTRSGHDGDPLVPVDLLPAEVEAAPEIVAPG